MPPAMLVSESDIPESPTGVDLASSPVEIRETWALQLLESLPRSSLANIQRKLTTVLNLNIIGILPTELALLVLTYLPAETLLVCSQVSRQWCRLANDGMLWRRLCNHRGWAWRDVPPKFPRPVPIAAEMDEGYDDQDIAQPHTEIDETDHLAEFAEPQEQTIMERAGLLLRVPDYKLLYMTRIRLSHRVRNCNYRLTTLQQSDVPNDAHTNAIYCLQLYTYPRTGIQVLFTGSKDTTVREWNLEKGVIKRVIAGVHSSSVLSLWAHDDLLVTGGSDRLVVVRRLDNDEVVKIISDHLDSVLCVRFDDKRLVTCSKDCTIRTYLFPDLKAQFVLSSHRSAVNAISISSNIIASGSGDRSIRLWDADTGTLLKTFRNHHTRGIASIDFMPPYVVSGSSDKNLRFFDVTSCMGWSTVPTPANAFNGNLHHQLINETTEVASSAHTDLVRSVTMNEEFIVSGSYDLQVKVWDTNSGEIIADLGTGGHTGRIFCIAFDRKKIVSCGEDMRICVWDFSHGMDTSFVNT